MTGFDPQGTLGFLNSSHSFASRTFAVEVVVAPENDQVHRWNGLHVDARLFNLMRASPAACTLETLSMY